MLTTYQENHLLPVYHSYASKLYPETIEASKAHVIMLIEQELIPTERGVALLQGLVKLTGQADELPEYDGTFEDAYFAFERNLADAAGVDLAGLDVQLARSRNDLDAGIFRTILRREVAEVQQALMDTAAAALAAADSMAETVIIGLTHRRPAQPTTIGHVLAGYAEAVLGELRVYESVVDELQKSPLGSCAFAGTDLPINPQRVADLMGFESRVINSYEAVAGADHLVAVGLAHARSLTTGARLARLLMDWMTWLWIETPPEFCQGSSIMPQKRNPVVLEHMASMAGQAVADATSVLNNVSAAWWEDSNNATTDVQQRLWESTSRARRFFTMMARLLTILTPYQPPTAEQIVDTGATTTAAADALTRAGIPFRGAHSTLSSLVDAGPPEAWTPELLATKLAEKADGATVSLETLQEVLRVARDPEAVLARPQDDGPGADAVREQVRALGLELAGLREAFDQRRGKIARAREELQQLVERLTA